MDIVCGDASRWRGTDSLRHVVVYIGFPHTTRLPMVLYVTICETGEGTRRNVGTATVAFRWNENVVHDVEIGCGDVSVWRGTDSFPFILVAIGLCMPHVCLWCRT